MTVLLHLSTVLSCLADTTFGLFLLWLIIQPSPHFLPVRYYFGYFLLCLAVCTILKLLPVHGLIQAGIMFLLALLYCLRLSEYRVRISLILTVLLLGSVYACNAVVPALFPALYTHISHEAIAKSTFFVLFGVLASRSLLYLLWGVSVLLFYRRKYPVQSIQIYAPQWMILFAVMGLLAGFALLLRWMLLSHPESTVFILGISSFIFIIAILLFLFTVSLSHEIYHKRALRNALLHAEQKLEQQKNIQHLYEQTCGMQHDLRNHMQIIGALAKQRQDAEMHAYIQSITGPLIAGRPIIHTGVAAVDALMSAKFLYAEERGIALRAKVHFPEPLAIAAADLCTALFNLLDNAIEACEKNQDVINRCILFELYQHNHFLVICCRNPSEIEPDFSALHSFQTTKEGDMHGLGMRQLQRIAEKYHGIFDAVYEQGKFTAKLALSHQVNIRQIRVSYSCPHDMQAEDGSGGVMPGQDL